MPSTAVEVCHHDGFGLNSGVRIENGDGALLVGGEAFSWRPWSVDEKGGKRLVNEKGQWEVGEEAWGVLGALWPRPGKFCTHRIHHPPAFILAVRTMHKVELDGGG